VLKKNKQNRDPSETTGISYGSPAQFYYIHTRRTEDRYGPESMLQLSSEVYTGKYLLSLWSKYQPMPWGGGGGNMKKRLSKTNKMRKKKEES
jgi:hypothetical protein